MSGRLEFEKRFPVPNGVKWSEKQKDYTYECIQALQVTCSYSGKWQAWQAARESEGGEAAFVRGEPLYIRLTKDLTGGPDETFADIEDGNGFSVKISRIEDGNDWLIGPIYEVPKSSRPQPDNWIPEGWKLVPEKPTGKMLDAWFDEEREHTGTDIDFYPAYKSMLDAAPTPPEQESE